MASSHGDPGILVISFGGYWGSMLLQFLFCVGPTLGASVKYGLDGLLGTVLAWANMRLGDRCLSLVLTLGSLTYLWEKIYILQQQHLFEYCVISLPRTNIHTYRHSTYIYIHRYLYITYIFVQLNQH